MPVFALVSIKKADYNSLIILLIFYPGTVAYKSALVPTKKKTIYSCPCSRTSFCQILRASKDSSLSMAKVRNTAAIPL
jgi:hypothetical protein